MELTDASWTFWAKEPFQASAPKFEVRKWFGTYWEPDSSRWCASLMEPVRERLNTPFTVLDWGCGDGRLFNFLSKRFQSFKYYGLERPGTFGDECIVNARGYFKHDPRAEFDVYGTPLETRAVASSGIAVLGSIATHISFPEFESIMVRILPIAKRGGVIVSSFFFDKVYHLGKGNTYGREDCYDLTYYTRQQVSDMCLRMGLVPTEKSTCYTTNCLHHILDFRKA